tara:strand:- start:665 stop:856 length:192 start_codon:yes stop_codon:yes gene_type:complete
MPLYNFKCSKCDHMMELMIKANDYEDRMCPKCRRLMKRQFPSGGDFKLKGDGWYKDGYTKDKK